MSEAWEIAFATVVTLQGGGEGDRGAFPAFECGYGAGDEILNGHGATRGKGVHSLLGLARTVYIHRI